MCLWNTHISRKTDILILNPGDFKISFYANGYFSRGCLSKTNCSSLVLVYPSLFFHEYFIFSVWFIWTILEANITFNPYFCDSNWAKGVCAKIESVAVSLLHAFRMGKVWFFSDHREKRIWDKYHLKNHLLEHMFVTF